MSAIVTYWFSVFRYIHLVHQNKLDENSLSHKTNDFLGNLKINETFFIAYKNLYPKSFINVVVLSYVDCSTTLKALVKICITSFVYAVLKKVILATCCLIQIQHFLCYNTCMFIRVATIATPHNTRKFLIFAKLFLTPFSFHFYMLRISVIISTI